MLSENIRKSWNNFWLEQNHKELKPAPLIPQWDTTSLFTVAWMQQLVPYLSWKSHKDGTKLFNIQKCIRTPDIDEIWDERHLTMFEMMWNWSLWDYFKKGSIIWTIDYLTKVCDIPLEKLWATIYAWDESLWLREDVESRQILNELWIPDERIRAMKENWWGPAGEVGPCGPDCEFYYDRGDKFWPDDWLMDDNDRYTEIWNNVFMEFYKDWNFEKLSQQNIDTGMGLERLVMILQDKSTIFETDLFEGIIKTIEKYTQLSYPPYIKKESEFNKKEKEITRRFRIITDHIRASLFLISDGVIPSNEWRGYVLRRLIRRAFYNMYLLNENVDYKKLIYAMYEAVENKYWQFRENLKNNKTLADIIINEIWKFEKTIQKWLKLLNEEIEKISGDVIDGETCFKLYDTFWFPLELTKEIWESKSYIIDEAWFKKYMQKAKEKSKENAKTVFKRWIDWAAYLQGMEPTQFVGYDKLEEENMKVLKYFEVDNHKIYVFDKTPFYAEWGGQTADKGKLILDDGTEIKIKDVQNVAWVYLHFVE